MFNFHSYFYYTFKKLAPRAPLCSWESTSSPSKSANRRAGSDVLKSHLLRRARDVSFPPSVQGLDAVGKWELKSINFLSPLYLHKPDLVWNCGSQTGGFVKCKNCHVSHKPLMNLFALFDKHAPFLPGFLLCKCSGF